MDSDRDTTHNRSLRQPALSASWTDAFGRVAMRAAQLLLVGTVALALLYLAVRLRLLMVPLLIALIVCAAFLPLVQALKRHLPDALAAIIALLLGGIGLVGAISVAVIRVQAQFDSLQASVLAGFEQALHFVHHGPLPIDAARIAQARQALVDFATSSQFGADAVAGMSAAMQLLTGFVLGLFILFYFLKDGPAIWAFLLRPLHGTRRQRAQRAGHAAIGVLGGYLRGTAIVALFDTLCIGLALWVLQVPLALPLAIVVFIGAFVPIIGATAAGVMAALVALVTVGLGAALWVSVVVLVVNQIESNVLSPLVLGKSLKLHPLVVLLVLTAGTILGGIIGTFLSVPLTGVAWAVAKSWQPAPPVNGGSGTHD